MPHYATLPTLEKLHLDDAKVRGIMGPYGSGKSVGCCWEIFFRCCMQKIGPTGKRRSRWAVVRNTQQMLKDTTLATWLHWFEDGGDYGKYVVTDATYQLRWGDVEADILFRPLDRPDDVRRLLSLELTGAWVNEAREIPWQIIQGITARTARYPPAKEEGCSWSGLILDTNPPDTDHWWYSLFEQRRPPGVDEISAADRDAIAEMYHGYRQPPGVVRVSGAWQENVGQLAGIPAAENMENLEKNYYRNLVVGKGPEWIKVYAEGKYGIVSEGRPVFPGYDDDRHCFKGFDGQPVEIPPDPALPLIAGQDSSVTGQAIVIAQLTKKGQLRVLQEVVSDDSSLEDFVEHGVKNALSRFSGFEWLDNWFDPNANSRSNLDERQAITYMNGGYEDSNPRLPFMTRPAHTNSPMARIDAVNHFLMRSIPKRLDEPDAPALLIDGVNCPRLRKAFQGRYEFKRVQISGEDRYKDMPNKNRYSHVAESTEYLCLGVRQTPEETEDEDEMDMPVTSGWSGY